MIGCVWSPEAGGLHGTTDIAVRPVSRGTGLGCRALAAAIRWVDFVDHENEAAHPFFTALAWEYRGFDDEMHRFELPAT